MKKYTIAIACLFFVFIQSSAFAEKTLTFATWLSPSDPHNSVVLPTWSKWIEKATEGRVKVKIENYVGHPKDLFNAVEDGTYAGSWSYHGYVPGRFLLTKIIEIPNLSGNTEKASGAYWDVYEKYLAKANEHVGLELIALFVHGPGQPLMNKPIRSINDLNGMKIRVGGGVQGDIAKELNVVGVPAPGSKVYEILQTGVADGAFMPKGQLAVLYEVVNQVYEFPKGMYLGSFAMFLSPDFMDSLSAKDQKAIRSVSGKKLSEYIGKVWGDSDKDGEKKARANGTKFVQASSADIQRLEKISKGIEKNFIRDAKKKYKNIDIQKALSELKSDLK